jgi:hypothetical protein
MSGQRPATQRQTSLTVAPSPNSLKHNRRGVYQASSGCRVVQFSG